MHRRWLGPLGVRLALAFVGVALAAVAALAATVFLVGGADVSRLTTTQQSATVQAVSSALTSAYQERGSWPAADLDPAAAVASAAGAALTVEDAEGTPVLRSGPQLLFNRSDATVVTAPLPVGGQKVGVVRLAFGPGGFTGPDRHLRSTLSEAVGWSAAVAVAVALVVALGVARGLLRPIRRLSDAVAAFGSGKSGTRVGDLAGPGELGELGSTFDSMADSLEREDRLRRALVADVAHELRTPIAILQAETEALLDGVSPPEPVALGSLHDEVVRLGRMVEDLQALASAEAAGLRLERRPLDLGRVAAEAIQSFRAHFASAEVTLDQSLPPVAVLGDPERLRQVVSNLLVNALKFTPAGGKVSVVVRREGGDAVLEVSDTGPGVPEVERARIWDRFYRGRAGTSAGGSGIGLAVVKELAVAHGGSAGVDAAPGGGAAFVVRLPLAAGASGAG